MTEREQFLAWLEGLSPPLPTTHDVEVAWRGWQARAAIESDAKPLTHDAACRCADCF